MAHKVNVNGQGDIERIAVALATIRSLTTYALEEQDVDQGEMDEYFFVHPSPYRSARAQDALTHIR